MSSTAESTRFLRFTISDRIEHVAQIATFAPLALTGLVQRYSESRVSQGIIDLLGGIEATRVIHRVFAALLMIAIVYHLGAIGYRRFVLHLPRSMGPSWADLRALRETVAYNLGRRSSPPPQGRFTFDEKLEYWSLVWGTALMVVTGFLLWNPIAATRFLPGSLVPAAKAAHGGEAVLALLAIIVWHMYHVHVRHFNRSIFTGYLTREEMEADHLLELTAPVTAPRPSDDDLSHRRTRYLAYYGSGAMVLLIGIWLFVTFEDTAITTVQPLETPTVFAPITTTTLPTIITTTVPDATIIPTAGEEIAWADLAPVFQTKCVVCHRADAAAGGLNLADYEAAVAGGISGPGIVPGDADASVILTIQAAGGHPSQFDADVLTALRAWIDAGASEVPGGSGPVGTPRWADMASLFASNCTACHGANLQSGGLSLATYSDALAGGADGSAIVPGDTDTSRIVIVLEAGGHPGQLDAAGLAALRAWIAADAPED